MKHVEEQRQRSGIRRHVEAGQDVEDVQGCLRRVETLCHELQVGLFPRCITDWNSNSITEQGDGEDVEEPGEATGGTLTSYEDCRL